MATGKRDAWMTLYCCGHTLLSSKRPGDECPECDGYLAMFQPERVHGILPEFTDGLYSTEELSRQYREGAA